MEEGRAVGVGGLGVGDGFRAQLLVGHQSYYCSHYRKIASQCRLANKGTGLTGILPFIYAVDIALAHSPSK